MSRREQPRIVAGIACQVSIRCAGSARTVRNVPEAAGNQGFQGQVTTRPVPTAASNFISVLKSGRTSGGSNVARTCRRCCVRHPRRHRPAGRNGLPRRSRISARSRSALSAYIIAGVLKHGGRKRCSPDQVTRIRQQLAGSRPDQVAFTSAITPGVSAKQSAYRINRARCDGEHPNYPQLNSPAWRPCERRHLDPTLHHRQPFSLALVRARSSRQGARAFRGTVSQTQ